ncbi:MAG: tetratricopeptide repeat protein [Magnetococcales bacterium]|nr:tetratricopeptide repeat protein [Magnetococcales bacterium]
MEEKLREGIDLQRKGRLEEAIRVFQIVVTLNPENVHALHLLGLAEMHRGNRPQAAAWLERVLALEPQNPLHHLTYADLLYADRRWSEALERYMTAFRLDPKLVEALCGMSRVTLETNRADQSLHLLAQALAIDDKHPEVHLLMGRAYEARGLKYLARVHQTLGRYFAGHPDPEVPRRTVQDLYYLDRELARATARKNLRVQQTAAISARQICYYDGEPFADGPETLINVPLSSLQDYFPNTRRRKPTNIQFDPADPEQRRRARDAAVRLDLGEARRNALFNELIHQCRKQVPVFEADQPLRVFMPASRLTTVMQYATKNLARAMAKQGCQVTVVIEQDDLETLDGLDLLRDQNAINPHVAIQINHLNNGYFHESVFNITWWQDPMPEITQGKPLPWRPRDIALSPYRNHDEFLRKTGVKRLYRQDFCVDLDRFRNRTPWEERTKAIFIGSSHAHFRAGLDLNEEKVWNFLNERFLAGENVSDATYQELSRRHGVDLLQIYDYLAPSVVRDTGIEWLCQMAPELDLEVEIYGRFWEKNPIVAPYFKGELPYGEPLVAAYNQARYSFSLLPHQVRTQRLVEMTACGCIPVVYDDRDNAEPPHWDDRILYFKTREQMRTCLTRKPPADPVAIAWECSYDALARQILDWIHQDLAADQGA